MPSKWTQLNQRYVRRVLRHLMRMVQHAHAERLETGRQVDGRFMRPLNNMYKILKKKKGQPTKPGIATGSLKESVLSPHAIRFPKGTKLVIDFLIASRKAEREKAFWLHNGTFDFVRSDKQSRLLRALLAAPAGFRTRANHPTHAKPFAVDTPLYQPPRPWIGISDSLAKKIDKEYEQVFAPMVTHLIGRRLAHAITREVSGKVLRVRIK